MRPCVLVPLVVLVAHALPALACGNALEYHRVDPNLLLAAERALDEARWEDALAMAEKLAESGHSGQKSGDTTELSRRVRRVAGLAHFGVKRYDYAARELRFAVRGRPDDRFLHAKFGAALAFSGQVKEASRELEPLARADALPDAETWTALALTRQATNDHAGSLEAARRALALDPKDARAQAIVDAPVAKRPSKVRAELVLGTQAKER